MKSLITNGTLISGKAVSPGQVLDLDDNTLRLLQENKKAVAYSAATDDQLKLVAAHEAAAKKGVK